jgi:hypothetical protein
MGGADGVGTKVVVRLGSKRIQSRANVLLGWNHEVSLLGGRIDGRDKGLELEFEESTFLWRARYQVKHA